MLRREELCEPAVRQPLEGAPWAGPVKDGDLELGG